MQRYISVYSGAGGLDLGITAAGLYPGYMLDEGTAACATLQFVFRKIAVAPADVHDVVNTGILEEGRARTSPWTLVAGQPPIVGGLVNGDIDPDGDAPQLMYRFMDVVAQARPSAFIMAGIPAIHGRPWAAVTERLRRTARHLGYDTFTPTLDASDFGVAQRKHRCFLIGMPAGCKPDTTAGSKVPARVSAGAALREAAAAAESLKVRDVPCYAAVRLAAEPAVRNSAYAGQLLAGGSRVIDLGKPAGSMPGELGGMKTPVIDLAQLESGAVPWIEDYHRGLWKEGKPPLAELPPGARLARLSLRQCAALQGFPPGHPFQGPPATQFRLAGRAVPPALGEAVARAVVAGLK